MSFRFFTIWDVMPFIKTLVMNRKDFSVHYEEQFNDELDCMMIVYVVIVHNKLA